MAGTAWDLGAAVPAVRKQVPQGEVGEVESGCMGGGQEHAQVLQKGRLKTVNGDVVDPVAQGNREELGVPRNDSEGPIVGPLQWAAVAILANPHVRTVSQGSRDAGRVLDVSGPGDCSQLCHGLP